MKKLMILLLVMVFLLAGTGIDLVARSLSSDVDFVGAAFAVEPPCGMPGCDCGKECPGKGKCNCDEEPPSRSSGCNVGFLSAFGFIVTGAGFLLIKKRK